MHTAIRLIKTEEDYELALERIRTLMTAETDTPEAEELEVIATLVELYEEENFPIDFPDPIAAIRFRMEQSGLSEHNLVPIIGSKAKVSELLAGKASLTLAMARALHNQLMIPAEVLLKEPDALMSEA